MSSPLLHCLHQERSRPQRFLENHWRETSILFRPESPSVSLIIKNFALTMASYMSKKMCLHTGTLCKETVNERLKGS